MRPAQERIRLDLARPKLGLGRRPDQMNRTVIESPVSDEPTLSLRQGLRPSTPPHVVRHRETSTNTRVETARARLMYYGRVAVEASWEWLRRNGMAAELEKSGLRVANGHRLYRSKCDSQVVVPWKRRAPTSRYVVPRANLQIYGQFDESKHPRAPAGSSTGGQFIALRAGSGSRPGNPDPEFSTFEMDVAIGVMRGLWQSFYVDGIGGTPTLAYDVSKATVKAVRKLPSQTRALFKETLPKFGRELGDAAGRYWVNPHEGLQDASNALEEAHDSARKVHSKAEFLFRLAGELRTLTPLNAQMLLVKPEHLEGHVSDEFLLLAVITQDTVAELTKLAEEAGHLDAETKAYVASYLFGTVLYEVAEAYIAKGASNYTKSTKFGRLLKKLEELPGIGSNAGAKAIVSRLTLKIARLFDTQVCFVAGTKVLTPDGSIKIEELRAGDMVLCRDEQDVDLTGQVMVKPVVRPIVTHPRQLWHVTMRAESGAMETVVTTASHPFFVLERSEFVAAAALNPGQTLSLHCGGTAEVVDVLVQHAAAGESFTTYNVEVAEAHTYFVGNSGTWVHNSGRLVCELLDTLYDRYKREGLTDFQARDRIQALLDQKVKAGRMTQEAADKHWKDASRAFRPSTAVQATKADYRHPKANTIYESNGYHYRTDAEGRLTEASGTLRLNKADRNRAQQRDVGHSSGVPSDDGGHMIAAQFDGPGEGPLHMVPQSMKINRGKDSMWTKMEREWRMLLDRRSKVDVSVSVDWPPGAKRPSGMMVVYEVTDAVTGATSRHFRTFPNL